MRPRRAKFGIMPRMKKPIANKLPNGKKQLIVSVNPDPKANDPMVIHFALDDVRAAIAKTNNPDYDPDEVANMLERKVATGETTRLNSEMWDRYQKIAHDETDGDAFAYIEMEFLAMRQIMDNEEPDFLPDIHENVLSAALSFGVRVQLPMLDPAHPKECYLVCSLPTPLEQKRDAAMTAVRLAILASASRAKRIGSDSYGLWRDALEVVTLEKSAPDGSMPPGSVKRLVERLAAANRMLALDAQIASYVPLSSPDANREEADDVL